MASRRNYPPSKVPPTTVRRDAIHATKWNNATGHFLFVLLLVIPARPSNGVRARTNREISGVKISHPRKAAQTMQRPHCKYTLKSPGRSRVAETATSIMLRKRGAQVDPGKTIDERTVWQIGRNFAFPSFPVIVAWGKGVSTSVCPFHSVLVLVILSLLARPWKAG